MIFFGYILLGCFAGTLSGLLGIGGGLIVVPGLLMLFRIEGLPDPGYYMHMAVGSSLTVMIVTTLRSFLAHKKDTESVWPIFKLLLPGVLAGVCIGGLFASFLNTYYLKIIFGVFVFIVAFRLLIFRKTSPTRKLPGLFGMSCVGFAIGAKSGLLGLGGGAITMPFLLHCNVSMRQAVVVSALTSLAIAISGSLIYFISGHVHWPALIGVAIGSVLFAPLGARLSKRLPTDTLRKIFAIFLIIVGTRLII